MSSARWLDHLPPWLAWGALATTGYYASGELALMALPLLAAALAQVLGRSLERWQRALELVAVAALAALVLLRTSLLPGVATMLFLLCGVRLCLPRGVAQRRQLLLMGFLLFLTTAVTTADLDFLLWSAAWVAVTATVLLQLNWEQSAMLRQGPLPAPPYLLVLGWSAATLVVAAGFFVTLPRLRSGLRYLPAVVQGLNGLQAGLSDRLDLAERGPIRSSQETAVRILPAAPPGQDPRNGAGAALGLLRGLVLEGLAGQGWEVDPGTPRRRQIEVAAPTSGWRAGSPPLVADFYMGPGLLGIVPLPYGEARFDPSAGDSLRLGPGASLRWLIPVRRTTALRITLTPAEVEPEAPPHGRRLALLTATGADTGSARDFGLREAPGDLPARAVAERLAGILRTRFRYTLDNPSGGAGNPLQDFLEHSQAGHCEYFASALAFMLRHRGVPARVAVGYRLGPWIEEGGYFLVTQGEAHSWVEYYDPASGGWRVADPTPGAPPSLLDAGGVVAALARWEDSLRFRWDRHVVRFSDQDQVAGLGWIQDRAGTLASWRPGPAGRGLAALAALGCLAWFWRRRPALPGGPGGPGRILAMRPLVRRAGRVVPPLPGETAHAWLDRLGRRQPRRALHLAGLARAVDAAGYGRGPAGPVKAMARAEARHW